MSKKIAEKIVLGILLTLLGVILEVPSSIIPLVHSNKEVFNLPVTIVGIALILIGAFLMNSALRKALLFLKLKE